LTLLASTALLGCAVFAQPAAAQEAPRDADCETTDYCRDKLRGKKHDDFGTHDLVIVENTEQIRVSDQGSIPFSNSVDGVTLDQSAPAGAHVATKSARAPERQIERERKTDLDLNSVDSQIKYDGLEAK